MADSGWLSKDIRDGIERKGFRQPELRWLLAHADAADAMLAEKDVLLADHQVKIMHLDKLIELQQTSMGIACEDRQEMKQALRAFVDYGDDLILREGPTGVEGGFFECLEKARAALRSKP